MSGIDLPLVQRRCRALDGGAPLADVDVQRHLAALTGWALDGAAIAKTFRFADFHRTMAFVNAVAWIAQADDHHPDFDVGYGHCALRLSTHSVGGVSINDFIVAAKVDALLAEPAAP